MEEEKDENSDKEELLGAAKIINEKYNFHLKGEA